MHFCPGTMKKMADGTIIVLRSHSNHPREDDTPELVEALKSVLKRRAVAENILLKEIYDEECLR